MQTFINAIEALLHGNLPDDTVIITALAAVLLTWLGYRIIKRLALRTFRLLCMKLFFFS